MSLIAIYNFSRNNTVYKQSKTHVNWQYLSLVFRVFHMNNMNATFLYDFLLILPFRNNNF